MSWNPHRNSVNAYLRKWSSTWTPLAPDGILGAKTIQLIWIFLHQTASILRFILVEYPGAIVCVVFSPTLSVVSYCAAGVKFPVAVPKFTGKKNYLLVFFVYDHTWHALSWLYILKGSDAAVKATFLSCAYSYKILLPHPNFLLWLYGT